MNFKITDVFSLRKNRNLLLIMRVFIFFCFTVSFAFTSKPSFSQNSKILIENTSKVSVEDVFEIIKNQTDYRFAYQSNVFENLPEVALKKGVISVKKLLQLSLKPFYNYEFDDQNNSIIIIPHQKEEKLLQKNSTVTGTVTDKEGLPLMGVTVLLKNKNIGVFTNEKGKYAIKVATDDVLIFTYIGFEKKEIKVANQKQIDVVLKEALNELDEIQITAYGKTSQRLSTGNITTITAKDIKNNPVMNVLQAIKGRVPGVYVEQRSGQAGSAFDIKIRGQNTLTRNAQPLLIVDGVPMPLGNLPEIGRNSTFFDNNVGGSGLNYLNPNDIESINFLKDAEATSIYGSRGANGVILITMKKGKKGAPVVAVSSRNGVSFSGRTPKLLKTEDYINYRREVITNSGDDPSFYREVNGEYDSEKYTDFSQYFFSTAALTSHNSISYSGGTDNTNYLVTGNFNKDDNIQNAKGNNIQTGLHFNLNTSSNNRKFKLGLTGTYTATKNTVVPFNTSALLAPPNSPDFYNEDGSLNWDGFDGFDYRNFARINERIYENEVNNLVSNLNLKFIPAKGLEVNANLGYSSLSSTGFNATPTTYFSPEDFFETNKVTLNTYNTKAITFEPNISYQTDLGNYGNIKIQSGATMQQQYVDKTDIFGSDIISNNALNNPTLADQDNVFVTYTPSVEDRYIGFFGLLNYNYANKYIFNSSVRYDGSTKFASGNRFGTFFSLSGAWLLSEENWFKENIDFISFAKIRASYGTTGGDNIQPFSYLSTYNTFFQYGDNIGLRSNGPANNNLQWEHTNKTEIGVNLEFLKGRVQLSHSYYTNNSDNQLVEFPSSVITGARILNRNSPTEIKNWGHEIAVTTQNIVTDNFSWSTNFNITFAKNKLVSFPQEVAAAYDNYVVGESILGVKLFDYQGVNPETGNYNFWRDLDRNGEVGDGEVGEWLGYTPETELIYDTDRTRFIDLAPDYYGGINNSFTVGNFNLNVFFSFTKKNITNFVANLLDSPLGVANITQDIYDARWQNPGDITDVPRLAADFDSYTSYTNYSASTGAYENVFFARLQNLSCSYNLPSNLLNNFKLKSLQFNVQAQNLLVISKYKGFDPETLGAGVPPVQTVLLGLNLSF